MHHLPLVPTAGGTPGGGGGGHIGPTAGRARGAYGDRVCVVYRSTLDLSSAPCSYCVHGADGTWL